MNDFIHLKICISHNPVFTVVSAASLKIKIGNKKNFEIRSVQKIKIALQKKCPLIHKSKKNVDKKVAKNFRVSKKYF